jgi:zinc transporter 1/2/3
MIDTVAYKSVWRDPGATAIDAVDGDLSASIQSFGVGAVDTSVPTAPSREFGFVVEYAVEDKSGNAAPLARRLIRVVCPKGESYCINPDTNQPTCTVSGVCGASQLLAFAAPGAASSTATSSSSSAAAAASPSSSSNRGSSNAAAAAAAAKPAGPAPPRISLLNAGAVQIPAGGVYDRCADNAPISAACERGVAAEDDRDGNMERQVLVCGNR